MGLFQRKQHIAASFIKSMNSSLSDHTDAVAHLLQTYDISEHTDDDEAFINILRFASDIGFRATAESFAESFPGDSFLLEFAEANPWEGPFKGHSTHVLDVAFLFQNYTEHLNEQQQASAKIFAADVIDFVQGQAPWKRFQDDGGRAIYQGGKRTYKEIGTGSKQYDLFLRLGSTVGMDTLVKAWGVFLVGL